MLKDRQEELKRVGGRWKQNREPAGFADRSEH